MLTFSLGSLGIVSHQNLRVVDCALAASTLPAPEVTILQEAVLREGGRSSAFPRVEHQRTIIQALGPLLLQPIPRHRCTGRRADTCIASRLGTVKAFLESDEFTYM